MSDQIPASYDQVAFEAWQLAPTQPPNRTSAPSGGSNVNEAPEVAGGDRARATGTHPRVVLSAQVSFARLEQRAVRHPPNRMLAWSEESLANPRDASKRAGGRSIDRLVTFTHVPPA